MERISEKHKFDKILLKIERVKAIIKELDGLTSAEALEILDEAKTEIIVNANRSQVNAEEIIQKSPSYEQEFIDQLKAGREDYFPLQLSRT